MNTDKLCEILTAHADWLHEGKGQRADLRDADLRDADLRDADLSGADLSGADLRDADLRGADLRGADLRGAELSGADLRDANLRDADLRDADLSGADLSGADLRGADLRGAINIDAVVLARLLRCPSEGEFTCWKKCRDGVLVKLKVPEDSRRSSSTSYKCRAEFVDVLEVVGDEVGVSLFDLSVRYKVGERVHCKNWNEDRWVECGGGIHFYMSREEAEDHP